MIRQLKRDLVTEFIKFVSQLSGFTPKNTPSPFFIIGCGRSGNTLLRKLIIENTNAVIPAETYVIPDIVKYYFISSKQKRLQNIKKIITEHPEARTLGIEENSDIFNTLRGDSDIYSILEFFYKYIASIDNITLVGDKTPLNTLFVERIQLIYPNAKFIYMHRNPLSVVSSYLDSGIYKNIDQATERWVDSITQLKKIKDKNPNSVLEIDYEDLVYDPAVQINRIIKFIGLKSESKPVKKLGDVEIHPHHENVKKAITIGNIEKYKQKLDKKQIKKIEGLLGRNFYCKSLYVEKYR